MTSTEQDGGGVPQYNHLEIIESLGISDDAAKEVANELGGDLGLIKDHTYDQQYFIVRWHDGSEEDE